MRVSVASAPVSFGVFEMTPEGADVITPDDMVSIVAEAGYGGIDLGPLGYLGCGEQLRRRLVGARLELAGGWVQLPFSDDDAFADSLATLRAVLRQFVIAAEAGPVRLPLPTLADDGSALRRSAPGRGAAVDPVSPRLRDRLYANVERAANVVRAVGLEPTFHHHVGTYVESSEEIDGLLNAVDIGMTLDTGHLVIAGGDPVEAVRLWGDRVNHLHVKDVDLGKLQRVLAAGGGMKEVWSSGAFVAFGAGDVDLSTVLSMLDDREYDGWIVVEQDVLNNCPDVALDEFVAQRADDQRNNRAALRAWA